MIGIDKLSLFTPNLYVDLVELAQYRGIDPDKFTIGIGQEKMSFASPTQDCYSMGANAAFPIISKEDAQKIDLVIFATESSLDFSKSGAVIIQKLLGIQPFCRSFEIKQACFGATAGLLMAKNHIKNNSDSKVLVIGSDIARYGLNTPGEVTQGAGAVAMLISKNPKLLAIDDKSVSYSDDIYDFFRPSYSDVAIVDGKFSNEAYLNFFNTVWNKFKETTDSTINDFNAICFHLPYTKMGLKALKTIIDEATDSKKEELLNNFKDSTVYSKQIGNLYTASLYLSLLSLLNNGQIEENSKIGLFSYGSGATCEFFTGTVMKDFKKHLNITQTNELLNNRIKLSISEYEQLFNTKFKDLDKQPKFKNDPSPFYLSDIDNHIRQYKHN